MNEQINQDVTDVSEQQNAIGYDSPQSVQVRLEKYFGLPFDQIHDTPPSKLRVADPTALNPPTQAGKPKSE